MKLGPRLKHSLSLLLINIFAEGLSHSNEAGYLKQIYGKIKSVIFHRQWFWIQIQQLTDVLSMLTEFKDIVLIQKLIVFLYTSNNQEMDENIPFEKSFQASKIYYVQGNSTLNYPSHPPQRMAFGILQNFSEG